MNKLETINLFEFGDWEQYEKYRHDFADFQKFLNGLWNNRHLDTLSYAKDEALFVDEEEAKEQQFLKLDFLKNKMRGRNFIGVIRYDQKVFNILPKIFKQNAAVNDEDLRRIHAHLLWWLSHCTKLKFPKNWSNFNQIKSNFFEVLIFLFAAYTKETLSKMVYQSYQEVNGELSYMKGRLDTANYVRRNLSTGRWHRLFCVYDSFEIDNRFNRIVKYVAKLLFSATQTAENKKLLNDIIFLLDGVSNVKMSVHDCRKVQINPLYRELNPILDYCRLFLGNSTVLQYKNDLEVFAFLLPMEVLFEDFVFGFAQKHFKAQLKNIQAQKSDKYLATLFYDDEKAKTNIFQLKHDIFIQKKDDAVIILDTKYKIIYTNTDSADKKHGVSQSDLYQMVSYAIRRKCREIKLIYPRKIGQSPQETNIFFEVKDEFSEQVIAIEIIQISVLEEDLKIDDCLSLDRNFADLETKLKEKFEEIIFKNNLHK